MMKIIAKVNAINTSDGMYNVSVNDTVSSFNIKVNPELGYTFKIGNVYEFTCYKNEASERVSYTLVESRDINQFDMDEYRVFYGKLGTNYRIYECDYTLKGLYEKVKEIR